MVHFPLKASCEGKETGLFNEFTKRQRAIDLPHSRARVGSQAKLVANESLEMSNLLAWVGIGLTANSLVFRPLWFSLSPAECQGTGPVICVSCLGKRVSQQVLHVYIDFLNKNVLVVCCTYGYLVFLPLEGDLFSFFAVDSLLGLD